MTFASIVWDVDPVLVHLGSLEIRWYGLMWGLGFILAYEIGSRMLKKEGCPDNWADKLFMYCIVSSVIGARLGHCLFYEWDYYGAHPIEILKIWKGGLASHGGVFALILGLIWYSKTVTKKSVWWLFDRLIPAVAVVCICIRFGNLMNSEIYGHATSLPWGFVFVRAGETQPMHPTQIYEARCDLAPFGILCWLYYRRDIARRRPGILFGIGLIGIFLTRFFIEFIKTEQEAFEQGWLLDMGQWLSIPFILLGIYMIYRGATQPEVVPVVPKSPAATAKKKKK